MKGVLLFAFNSPTVDYFSLAVYTAKRANRFLGLPVSVVTDKNTDLSLYDYKFDNVFLVSSDSTNTKNKDIWINKGRYQAYDLSPYDETLLIDVDYLINSDRLLTIFDIYDDFMCPKEASYVLYENQPDEMLSQKSHQSLWATVIAFKKTKKVKQIFECMKMVQENYSYYVQLHNILGYTYRNDFALTIALNIVNGQTENSVNYLPWDLLHVTKDVKILRKTDTSYVAIEDMTDKKRYCMLNDTDFHCLNKDTFIGLINE
jgi:hypothetical protein